MRENSYITVAPDVGHCGRFEVKVEDGQVWLAL